MVSGLESNSVQDRHRGSFVDFAGDKQTAQRVVFGILDFKWDFIDIQQTSSTVETYVYKNGGSGGTIVGTIVVTYTSSTKADLDTVERTV